MNMEEIEIGKKYYVKQWWSNVFSAEVIETGSKKATEKLFTK
jgi:hypothetical protein